MIYFLLVCVLIELSFYLLKKHFNIKNNIQLIEVFFAITFACISLLWLILKDTLTESIILLIISALICLNSLKNNYKKRGHDEKQQRNFNK